MVGRDARLSMETRLEAHGKTVGEGIEYREGWCERAILKSAGVLKFPKTPLGPLLMHSPPANHTTPPQQHHSSSSSPDRPGSCLEAATAAGSRLSEYSIIVHMRTRGGGLAE